MNKKASQMKAKRLARLAAGLCGNCGKQPVLEKLTRCWKCSGVKREREVRTRAANKKDGLCKCGRSSPRPGRMTCELCRAAGRRLYKRKADSPFCFCGEKKARGKKLCPYHMQQARDRCAMYHQRVRMAMFEAYGGPKCVCCGETTPEFLQIDHIDGGGLKHRRSINATGAGSFAHWLRRNGWPAGFQVLCANCNLAKGHYGRCPHQDRPKLTKIS